MERHVGWVCASFFSMAYHRSNEVGRLFYPYFHKVVGVLVPHKDDTTTAHYIVYKGLTDPVSLLLLFVGSFLICAVSAERAGLPWSYSLWGALLCTGLAAGITFLFSTLSPLGRQAQKQLKDTMQVILTNTPVL